MAGSALVGWVAERVVLCGPSVGNGSLARPLSVSASFSLLGRTEGQSGYPVLVRREWEFEGEGRAFAEAIGGDLDIPAVGLGNAARDREPDPAPSARAS